MSNNRQDAMKIKYGTSRRVLSSEIKNSGMYLIHGTKCFCAACSTLQEIPESVHVEGGPRWDSGYVECSDCGNVGRMMRVSEDKMLAEGIVNPKNDSLSFFVPKRNDVFISEDDKGKITKMSSSIMLDHITVYDSGKSFVSHERFIQDYNVADHQIRQMEIARGKDGKDVSIGVFRNSNRFSMNNTVNPLLQNQAGFDDRGYLFNIDYAPISMPITTVYVNRGNVEPKAELGRARFLFDIGDVDSRSRDVMYDAVAKEYGLPSVRDASPSFKLHTVEFATLYPAVMQYEMDKLNVNMDFTNKRREADGDQPLSEEEKMKMRAGRLVQVETSVALMDNKLSSDLSKMNTPEQVGAYLKAIAFGGKPEVAMPVGVKVKPSEAVNDGFQGKKLRTRFNINPYATASNVRTALKLGFGDPNYLNALFEIADKGVTPKEAAHVRKQPAIGGIVRPIESQSELRFAKLIVNGRGPAQGLQDIYGSRENMELFLDSAGMYQGVAKGKLAVTEDELNAERVLGAMKQVERQYRSRHGDLDAVCSNETFKRSWGDDTKQMVEFMLAKYKEYTDRGAEPEMYIATTDGRPLFKNRTMSEIHDELTTMQNKYRDTSEAVNYYFDWTKAQQEKANKEIGDYVFHLADSSNELIRMGHCLHICVGGSNYDDMCRNRRGAIVAMEDRDGNYVACIELDSNLTAVRQFKRAYNGTLVDADKVAAARQWMEEGHMRGCEDTEHFGDANYYPYGRRNFDVGRALLAEREVVLPNMRDCMKAFKFLSEQHAAEAAKETAKLEAPSMAD